MPINDQTMTYDYTAHRYVLTEQYAFDNGIDLNARLNTTGDSNPSTVKSRLLAFVSRHLYNWIYSYNPRFRQYTEYVLATDEGVRDTIREALLNELSFILDNGIFWNTAGVKREIYEHSRVSEETKALLMGTYVDNQGILYSGNIIIPHGINLNHEGY